MKTSDWTPRVPKQWLPVLSGLTWSGVGLLLIRWTWVWLRPLKWIDALPFLTVGVVSAVIIQIFFARMAHKNIHRIEDLPSRPCLFAFQAWTSYPLVVFMVSLGLALRSSPIPKPLLAGLYLAIGGGLFLASLRYYKYLIRRSSLHKVMIRGS